MSYKKSEVAQLLDVTRPTLDNWIERLHLQVKRAKQRTISEEQLEILRKYQGLNLRERHLMEEEARLRSEGSHGSKKKKPDRG